MMELSIFPIWHSQETLGLYEYIQEQSKTDHPLILAGYDMQFTTGYLTQFISDWISSLDPARGKQFYAFEMQGITDLYAVLNKYGIDSDNNPEFKAAIHQVKDAYAPRYEELVQWITEHKQELVKSFPDNPKLADMMIRVLKDRSKFIEMAAYDTRESYEFRDRAMADNLEWLMDVMYPGKNSFFGLTMTISPRAHRPFSVLQSEIVTELRVVAIQLQKHGRNDAREAAG